MMRYLKSLLAAVVLIATTAGACAQTAPGVQRAPGGGYHKRVCSAPPQEGVATCLAEVATDARGTPKTYVFSERNATRLGVPPYYARDLWHVYYGTTARPPLPAGSVAPDTTPTVAVVAAYGYNGAAADLAQYRRLNKLPPLCSKTVRANCVRFQKLNQSGVQGGYPLTRENWSLEQAIDVQMVSAMCPWCNIVLVQARSANYSDLGPAELTASKVPRTIVITNSFGGPERGSLAYTPYFTPSNVVINGYRGKLRPSIAVVAASGDHGYAGSNVFPAVLPLVIAAGGTRLTHSAGRWTEQAWAYGGSACSAYYSQMAWQTDVLPSGACSTRVASDVAAVADPETGVAVYYNGRILRAGGTSVSSPIIAGIIAQRNVRIPVTLAPGSGSVAQIRFPKPGGANIATSYGRNLYANRGALRDVTSGSNGTCGSYLCRAGAGFDGPTGVGAPRSIRDLSPF